MKRCLGVILTIVMLLSLMPMSIYAAESLEECYVGECDITNLTFLSEGSRRQYIQNMLSKYISSNSNIYTALDNNKVAIFMFEGGSDNMDKSTFSNRNKNRVHAVCLVVKKINGNYKVIFADENSTSMPDQPLKYDLNKRGNGTGPATLMDGTYLAYSNNMKRNNRKTGVAYYHAAPYLRTEEGNNVPCIYKSADSYVNSTSGDICLHMRSSYEVLSGYYAYSEGCQLVSCKNSSSSNKMYGFNKFIELITNNKCDLGLVGYYNGGGTTHHGDIYKYTSNLGVSLGTYTIDRQLFVEEMKNNIYKNSSVVDKIVENSKKASNGSAAGNNGVGTPHTCTKYETYKNGGTKVLGACKECHKAYNWQDTFSRVSNQTASLKSSKKNYKISVYSAPYEDATKTTAKNAISKFAIVGIVKNAYGNEWYAIDFPDDVKKVCYIAYVYKSTLTDNYDIVTTTVQEAKKYDSANVSTKKHTHDYNYDNGRCYCGEQKQVTPQTYDESTLKINLTQYPSQHTQGNNFGLRGTISSNYKVKKIYGYIKQNGNVIQSTEDTPNTKSVDVKKQNLNNNLVFDRLSPGNYTLEVQAVDASGNSIRVSKDFTVVGEVVRAESTLSINLEKYPVTLNAGSGFGLRGSVNSNYDISVVRGYVINSNGQTVLSSKDTPYSTSLNIKSARLNNDLVFNNLSAGNYTLKVVAADSSGRTVEVLKGFSVVSPQKTNNSSLSINLEKYPVTLNVGSSYGLRGSITSNYNISVVRGYVTNSSGQTVLSSKDTPNSTYMDIKPSNLNWDLVFNNLSAGNYTMRVVAIDASGRTVEATKNFTVKAKETYVDNSPNGNGVTGVVDIPSTWDNLSIRSGPSTSYQIVGSMNDGVKCTVYPNKTSNGWYYVNYNGIWGYASGNQINLNTSSNTQTQNTRVGIVNIPSSWDNLSIRSGPSTNYQIVGSMNQGARCTVYPDKTSNGWYYVEYNGIRGYASGKQINLQ